MAQPLDAEQLGRYVRRLRKSQQLSLHAVADRADVNATWLMRLERGEYASPDARLLVGLAEALGIDVADLFAEAGLTTWRALPSLQPYLRTKYELPEPAVRELFMFFEYINHRYGGKGGGENDTINRDEAA
jgi:transcriptional regulator with XRE-family HTH domain